MILEKEGKNYWSISSIQQGKNSLSNHLPPDYHKQIQISRKFILRINKKTTLNQSVISKTKTIITGKNFVIKSIEFKRVGNTDFVYN